MKLGIVVFAHGRSGQSIHVDRTFEKKSGQKERPHCFTVCIPYSRCMSTGGGRRMRPSEIFSLFQLSVKLCQGRGKRSAKKIMRTD
jgi:hypothetical protein